MDWSGLELVRSVPAPVTPTELDSLGTGSLGPKVFFCVSRLKVKYKRCLGLQKLDEGCGGHVRCRCV